MDRSLVGWACSIQIMTARKGEDYVKLNLKLFCFIFLEIVYSHTMPLASLCPYPSSSMKVDSSYDGSVNVAVVSRASGLQFVGIIAVPHNMFCERM